MDPHTYGQPSLELATASRALAAAGTAGIRNLTAARAALIAAAGIILTVVFAVILAGIGLRLGRCLLGISTSQLRHGHYAHGTIRTQSIGALEQFHRIFCHFAVITGDIGRF